MICSQQLSNNDAKKSTKNFKPSFMIFIPKRISHLQNTRWTGDVILIRASESTQLALNSTELKCLHLVVIRSDHWQDAVDTFQYHTGTNNNIQRLHKLARDEDIRFTFEQLPELIDNLTNQLLHLVRTLNAIWDKDSIKIFLTEIIKFDERQLRTIESKLLDLVLYVYNSGFELFRLLYQLLPSISLNDKILKKFVSTMNEFFCEWCKCVTKKFECISTQQTPTAKYKVLRPRWLSPGIIFLGFLGTSPNLQLLTDDEYTKLLTEMLAALKALRGNTLNNRELPLTKIRSKSLSSTLVPPVRSHRRLSGHRRFDSGGGINELLPFSLTRPIERIRQSIKNRDNLLEQKLRERKQIGHIYKSNTTISGTTVDPAISLKTRTIDFPWRRGTRIGQGGAGVAFRAINCSNGSIVCMKEIQLSSIASRSLPSSYPEKLRCIAEEIDMIMSINHPNIVRYFGIEKYKRTIYICMEYCLSTVKEFLNDIRTFQSRAYSRKTNKNIYTDSSDQDDDAFGSLVPSFNINELVRGFVKQLLQALLALHEHYIVHCDVKGDNIFIANENGNYIVKLGDFNLSHRLEIESPSANNDSRSTQFGTLHFKPPEPEYVYQSDIWGLGCTVIEMLTGKLPWTNVTRQHEEQIYIQNQLLAKKGPPIPDELKSQPEAYDFIRLCLIPDVNQRPLAKALLDHPYSRVSTGS